MEGCLESAEEDKFDYCPLHNECIATRKNGKTYLHFCNGLMSSAVALKNYPSTPCRVRLMNTGDELEYKIECLPEYYNGSTGRAEIPFLHIRGIPIDELSNEPIVLEIEW